MTNLYSEHEYFSSRGLFAEEINASIVIGENINLSDLLNASSVELIVEEPNNIIEEVINENEEAANAEDIIEEVNNENEEEANAEGIIEEVNNENDDEANAENIIEEVNNESENNFRTRKRAKRPDPSKWEKTG